MGEPLIKDVSDTARWVAAYRAIESSRPDALFEDPYAEKLAGGLANDMDPAGGLSERDGWSVVTRTRLIDDMIARSISDGCTRIVNLAAGFDTRPYRLALPPLLTWIEVDLQDVLVEKSRALAGDQPRCKLGRAAVDLTDTHARRALLDEVALPGKTLVITEGLLGYLDEADVRALVTDFRAVGVRWWITDLISVAVAQALGERPDLGNAPKRFAPRDGVAHFERFGWRVVDVDSLFSKAADYRRLPEVMRPFAFPEPDPRAPGEAMWSAVVRFLAD